MIDGAIWGRGSCDMKDGNAAALTAIKAVLQAGLCPKGDVILEYVVGEEMMNTEAGTGATIDRGYTADAAIVVEDDLAEGFAARAARHGTAAQGSLDHLGRGLAVAVALGAAHLENRIHDRGAGVLAVGPDAVLEDVSA
mgnify:CR=1 FL=1